MIRVLAGMMVGLALAACEEPSSHLLKLQPLASSGGPEIGADAGCSRHYGNAQFSIVEVFCGNDADGLYLVSGTDAKRYDWYDPRFNSWAVKEGCVSDDACYYRVSLDARGTITAFTYVFRINLSEGEYRVSVEHGRLRVQGKRISDTPS